MNGFPVKLSKRPAHALPQGDAVRRALALSAGILFALALLGLAYRYDHRNAAICIQSNGSSLETLLLTVTSKEIIAERYEVQPATSQEGKFLVYRHPQQFVLHGSLAGKDYAVSVKETSFERVRIGDQIAIAGSTELGVVLEATPILADFKAPVFGSKLNYSDTEKTEAFRRMMRYFVSRSSEAQGLTSSPEAP